MGKITALVTGSNRGIGKAIADKFEDKGFNVIRNGVSNSNYNNYIKADIGKKDEVLKIKNYINKNFSGLLICSKQCEIIILSKKLFSNGKFTPS